MYLFFPEIVSLILCHFPALDGAEEEHGNESQELSKRYVTRHLIMLLAVLSSL